MDFFSEGILEGIKLIISGDKSLYSICFFTLYISIISVIAATIISLPISYLISSHKFRGKKLVILITNSLMSIPTVLIGLIGYGLLSHRGIFGKYNLLFTPYAIIFGQTLLALPLITSLFISVFKSSDERIRKTAITLGASQTRSFLILINEEKIVLFSTIMAGFARVFSEVGIAMMLGGNIRGYTRTITTTIALEIGKGDFAQGVALGLILLFISFTINLFLNIISRKKSE